MGDSINRLAIPDHHRRWLVIGLLLAVAFRLVLAYLGSDFPYSNILSAEVDTNRLYKPLAVNLMAGHGFSMDLAPPYHPSVFRTPIYPLFLAGIYWLASFVMTPASLSFNDTAVVLVQILLSAASCLVFYGLAREVFVDHTHRDDIALVAFFFLALNPFTNALNSYFMTEPLSQVLLLFSLYWMVRAINTGRSGQAVASGVFAALTFLNHSALAGITALLVLWLLWSVLRGRIARGLFIGFMLGVLIPWTPWVARNYAHFGRFVPLTVGGGPMLYLNISHLDENPDRFQECWGPIPQPNEEPVLFDGQEGIDADARCLRLTLQVVRDHPWAFARHSLKKPVRMWLTSHSSNIFPISDQLGTRLISWNRALIVRFAKEKSLSQAYVWFLVGAKLLLRLLNPLFILTGLFGLIKVCQNGLTRTQWPILLVLLGHTIVLMFLSDGRVRYMVVVWPYLLLLSAYGCWVLWRLAAHYRGASVPQQAATS